MIEATYTPQSRPRGFSWGGFSPRAYADTLFALVVTQIKVRYRYTTIGLGWTVLQPLMQMAVYAYIFTAIFSESRANYKLFLLAGLLPWQAFSSGVSTSIGSILSSGDLLKKAPFPSELLPISTVITALFNFVLVFIFYVGYLALRGFPVLSAMEWILLAIVIEAIFLTGLALAFSCLDVFFRDVEQLMGFGIWIWFFLTPIFYPLSRLSALQAKVLLVLNPMAVVVTTVQNALLKGAAPPIKPVAVAASVAVGALIVGWALFRHYQYEFPKSL